MPENKKTRLMDKMRDRLRLLFVGARRASSPDNKHHESNLFWGPIAIGASLVLAVVTTMKHDLRFLLWLSWPCFVFGAWHLRKIVPYRAAAKWVFVLSSLLAGVGLYAIWDWVGPPPSTPPPLSPLRISDWERLPRPLRAGQPVAVHLHIKNYSSPVKVRGFGTWIYQSPRPDGMSYDERKSKENELWSTFLTQEKNAGDIPLTTIPADYSGRYWIEMTTASKIYGTGIDDVDITRLHSCGTVYFMGQMKDTNGNVLLEFCAFTGLDDNTVGFCMEHN